MMEKRTLVEIAADLERAQKVFKLTEARHAKAHEELDAALRNLDGFKAEFEESFDKMSQGSEALTPAEFAAINGEETIDASSKGRRYAWVPAVGAEIEAQDAPAEIEAGAEITAETLAETHDGHVIICAACVSPSTCREVKKCYRSTPLGSNE